jgi:hypothetical protein
MTTVEEEKEEAVVVTSLGDGLAPIDEDDWLSNYYAQSEKIQDLNKRKQFRAVFDKLLIEEPTWSSYYFSDIPERRMMAVRNFEEVTRYIGKQVRELQQEMIAEGNNNTDEATNKLLKELLTKIEMAKQQQRQQQQD